VWRPRRANHAIVDAVGKVAAAHGVSRASIALARLHRQPVVPAPLVGANSTQQIDDAIASLDVEFNDANVNSLIAPYTPLLRRPGRLRRSDDERDPRPRPGMPLT